MTSCSHSELQGFECGTSTYLLICSLYMSVCTALYKCKRALILCLIANVYDMLYVDCMLIKILPNVADKLFMLCAIY